MGNFYVNFTLNTKQLGDVVRVLEELNRRAYVIPPAGEYIVVCDEECDEQDEKVITALAAGLSRQLRCAVLAVLNHDDDILWYSLYQDGTLSDQYNSCPDCFGPVERYRGSVGEFRRRLESIARGERVPLRGPTGGDAARLCEVFHQVDSLAEVEHILHSAEGYVFACDQHAELACALGLPVDYVTIRYSDLAEFEEDAGSPPAVRVAGPQQLEELLGGYVLPPGDLDTQLRDLLQAKMKTSAILLYQQRTQCTLEEARRYVESLQ